MNGRQLSVLVVGVILFSLSELFPPWLYEDGWDSAKRSAGYNFHNSPPEVKSPDEMKRIFLLRDNERPHSFGVQEDMLRLDSQRLFLLSMTIGGLLALSSPRSSLKMVFGGLSICVGVVFLLLVLNFSWSVHY